MWEDSLGPRQFFFKHSKAVSDAIRSADQPKKIDSHFSVFYEF
jgi:hypothetical protein